MGQTRSTQRTLALILVAFGIFFLVINLVSEGPGIDSLWPFIILMPGLLLLGPAVLSSSAGQRRTSVLAIPGTILVALGLILLFSATTGYWRGWAYYWTLMPASVGLGVYLAGRFGRWGPVSLVAGRWMIYTALIAFLIFGVFFEVIIFGLGGRFWPILLVLVGAVLLLWGYRSHRFSEPPRMAPGWPHPSTPGAHRHEGELGGAPAMPGHVAEGFGGAPQDAAGIDDVLAGKPTGDDDGLTPRR